MTAVPPSVSKLRNSGGQRNERAPIKKTHIASTSIPVNLDDIQNVELRSNLANCYVEKPSPAEKLSLAQLAFLFYWLNKKGGSSGNIYLFSNNVSLL